LILIAEVDVSTDFAFRLMALADSMVPAARLSVMWMERTSQERARRMFVKKWSQPMYGNLKGMKRLIVLMYVLLGGAGKFAIDILIHSPRTADADSMLLAMLVIHILAVVITIAAVRAAKRRENGKISGLTASEWIFGSWALYLLGFFSLWVYNFHAR
jgi:hypothetical protein